MVVRAEAMEVIFLWPGGTGFWARSGRGEHEEKLESEL